MTGDISKDESRVCRCTMVLFPCDKSFPRKEDVSEEVSMLSLLIIFLSLNRTAKQVLIDLASTHSRYVACSIDFLKDVILKGH